jgi:hypothetical protein
MNVSGSPDAASASADQLPNPNRMEIPPFPPEQFPPEHLSRSPGRGAAGTFPPAANDLRSLRDLAVEASHLVARHRADLGWSATEVFVFQIPLRRIREAAQAALDQQLPADTSVAA